jgi:hypothetical protein
MICMNGTKNQSK